LHGEVDGFLERGVGAAGGGGEQQALRVVNAHDQIGALHFGAGGAELLDAEAARVGAIGAGAGGNEGIVAAPIPVHDLHRGAGEGFACAEAHRAADGVGGGGSLGLEGDVEGGL
jgi:hypothetical protein